MSAGVEGFLASLYRRKRERPPDQSAGPVIKKQALLPVYLTLEGGHKGGDAREVCFGVKQGGVCLLFSSRWPHV
jgi:hypothetical protein